MNNMGLSSDEAKSLAKDIADNARIGTCYTAFVDNVAISIGGIAQIRKGIGEAWTAPTRLIAKYPKFYIQTVRWGIIDGITKLNLRRLQTICSFNDPVAYNWQKRLGFEFEGIMKAFNDDGSDAIRMAMVCGKRY